jgi:Zn-dependent protease with chaperone function
MTHQEFIETVNRLEEYARREPGKYRLRVGLLAALGYAYILLALAVTLALSLGVFYMMFEGRQFNFLAAKLGWVLLMLAALLARALWVKVPAPKGVEISREEAPQLFALADELTSALEAPRVHTVLVNGAYNASLSQVPRLGVFGWHRNYLTLGLPLMQAVTPEQFRAVLAHELGHLSGNHGRFGSWIYRVRMTWAQLLERLARERRRGSSVFTKFVNWYAPHFNAYSFVLARQHEYDADRAAAQAAGHRDTAEALALIELKGSYLSERYWPEFFSRADVQAEPTRGSYLGMAAALRGTLPDAQAFLRRSLAQETGYDDTHPSLAARLEALGLDEAAREELAERLAREHEAKAETAAARYLGAQQEETLARRLDEEWCTQVGAAWRDRHRYVKESRRKLAALEEKALAKELSVEEAWSRAFWTAEFKNADEAVPLLRELVARRPRHADANSLLGQILIARGDESGVEHVERAMNAQPQNVPLGCQLLYAFFRERGREPEAEKYRRRLLEFYDSASG